MENELFNGTGHCLECKTYFTNIFLKKIIDTKNEILICCKKCNTPIIRFDHNELNNFLNKQKMNITIEMENNFDKFLVKMCMPKTVIFDDIDKCERQKHFQQVVYSTHGVTLTQICFNCHLIRTTYKFHFIKDKNQIKSEIK